MSHAIALKPVVSVTIIPFFLFSMRGYNDAMVEWVVSCIDDHVSHNSTYDYDDDESVCSKQQ